jgi:O-antigen biosynthesis protein
MIKKFKNKIKRRFPWIVTWLAKIPFLQKKAVYLSNPLVLLPQDTNWPKNEPKSIKIAKATGKIQVSIVIAVYNEWSYTYNLLLNLSKHQSKFTFEVIVVNDQSTDGTEHFLHEIENIKTIHNTENQGFIVSCNKGAAIATGQYLVFLNNDTQPQLGWLDCLIDTFEQPKAGLVGSMLIYPNGQLQEAGGLVWANGSAHNYGRLQNASYPQYNFLRKTDYVSGAAMAIPKRLFEDIGQFDSLFIPAYYEDTDLAMKVRKAGYDVLVQPASKIVHFEGISSGTDTASGTKKYQVINHGKFTEKWHNTLINNHLAENNSQPILNILHNNGQKVILVADYFVPLYNQNSGSNRLFQIIKILRKLNHYVIFLPQNGEHTAPYTIELQQLGVHVLYNCIDKTADEFMTELLPHVHIAWLCNPVVTAQYLPIIKTQNPNTKIIYDTIDLHFVRMKREAELQNKTNTAWQKMKETEINIANTANMVLAVSQEEEQKLKNITSTPTQTVPNIHQYRGGLGGSYAQRCGLLFIGGYHHAPNVDAAQWLINEIMPIVWQKIPNLAVQLLGSNPPYEVQELAKKPNVTVPGFISDITEYFQNSRIFVAPLRYGAGMKGKTGQALEYGLPIVSTPIGTEGMFLTPDQHYLLATDSQIFAQKIIDLYSNEALWLKLQSQSESALKPFSAENVALSISQIIDSL